MPKQFTLVALVTCEKYLLVLFPVNLHTSSINVFLCHKTVQIPFKFMHIKGISRRYLLSVNVHDIAYYFNIKSVRKSV